MAEEGVQVVSVSGHLQLAGGRITKIVASPYYMLPEVIKHNYGPEINVWIVGVILYILLCGVQTFLEDSEQGVAQAIMCSVVDFKRDPMPRVSEPAKDFVRQTLDPNPNHTVYYNTRTRWCLSVGSP